MATREEPLPPLLSSPVFSKKEGFKSLSKDKKKVGLEGGNRTDHTADVPGGTKKPGVKTEDEAWKISIPGWQLFNIMGHFGSTKEQNDDGTYTEWGAFAAKMEVLGIEIEPDAGKFSINLIKLESSLSVLAARADVDDQIRAELRGAREKGSYVGKLFVAEGPFAARIGDPTVHGDLLAGKGSPSVLIGGKPAMRAGIDPHTCTLQTGGVPHAGGVVTAGEPSVVINGFAAVRAGDVIIEPTGGPNPVASGDASVRIGLPAPPVWCWAPAPPPEPGTWESFIEMFGAFSGDFGYWKGDAAVGVEADSDGFSGKLGGGARASVLHGELAGGVKIKLPGGYSVTIGGVASGDLLSAGAKAEGKAVIGGEKSFIGLSGEMGAGVGAIGGGVKLVLAVDRPSKPEASKPGADKGKS